MIDRHLVEIRRIDDNNKNILFNVDRDIFDEKIDLSLVVEYAKEESHIMLVAIYEDLVIGQVLGVVHRHPDKKTELYIDDLAISERFQRKGIATQLLQELYLIGKQKGCKEVWVATEPDNDEALKFYKSMQLSINTAVIFEGKI